MKYIITEEQFNNIPEGDMPIGLKRRIHNVDDILKSVLKYYDVDEYNRFDFIDEVLHSIYDELDYDDVNSFFDFIRPIYYEKIGKIYDRKVKRRNTRIKKED